FFEALGDSVVTGPTLTNVNDFRAILITEEARSTTPGVVSTMRRTCLRGFAYTFLKGGAIMFLQRYLTMIIATLSLVAGSSSAFADELEDILQAGIIKIAVPQDFPP